MLCCRIYSQLYFGVGYIQLSFVVGYTFRLMFCCWIYSVIFCWRWYIYLLLLLLDVHICVLLSNIFSYVLCPNIFSYILCPDISRYVLSDIHICTYHFFVYIRLFSVSDIFNFFRTYSCSRLCVTVLYSVSEYIICAIWYTRCWIYYFFVVVVVGHVNVISYGLHFTQ